MASNSLFMDQNNNYRVYNTSSQLTMCYVRFQFDKDAYATGEETSTRVNSDSSSTHLNQWQD